MQNHSEDFIPWITSVKKHCSACGFEIEGGTYFKDGNRYHPECYYESLD